MAWSIDTTLAFLSFLFTGASSLVVIWDPIANAYRSIYRKGQFPHNIAFLFEAAADATL
jgi:hypothetical protein